MSFPKHQVETVQPELEIKERLDLHEKGWVVQRIGWGLMFATMLLTVLGLFGKGPISTKTVQARQITVVYERFWRYESEMKIKTASANDHIASIILSHDYLKNFRIDKIVPEPAESLTDNGSVVYLFRGNQNNQVVFYLMPKEYGTIKGSLKINNRIFSLHHFIYP